MQEVRGQVRFRHIAIFINYGRDLVIKEISNENKQDISSQNMPQYFQHLQLLKIILFQHSQISRQQLDFPIIIVKIF